MTQYWPFCTNTELNCDFAPAIAIVAIVVFVFFVTYLNISHKMQVRKEQQEVEKANQSWLTKNSLPDQTYRSIIEKYFRVGGAYQIGVPKIDWSHGYITLSVQNGGKTTPVDINLRVIRWVQSRESQQPTARFIYHESILKSDFVIGYYSHGDLQKAVEELTLEKVLQSAGTVEIILTPEQYKIVHESLI
jgi:hypothetical protein